MNPRFLFVLGLLALAACGAALGATERQGISTTAGTIARCQDVGRACKEDGGRNCYDAYDACMREGGLRD